MLFSAIPGQERIKGRLLDVLNQGRIPHAILLYGPEGNGGLAMALAMASYLLCENRSAGDACGECDSCSKTRHLVHPDLHFSFPVINRDGAKTSDVFVAEWRKALLKNPFLDYSEWMDAIKGKDDQNKQGNITAEECRDIIKKLSLKSYEGGKKFMILWLPEFLGQSGNILLKVLEEPPQDTHFILVAQDLNQVLPTILSRTQLFNVPAFTAGTLQTYLETELKAGAKEAASISYLSRGNINVARLQIEELENDTTETIRTWLQYCYARNIAGMNTWVNETASLGREKIKQLLESCIYILGECLHCKHINNYVPRVPEANVTFVVNFSKVLDDKKIELMYKTINETIYHIDRNANAKLSLLNLSLELRTIMHIKMVSI